MKKSLIALAFGTLGLGIAEFVMMGILPDVAKDLGISIPVAGHFISAYALGVCVGAPTLILARKHPLKHTLLALVTLIMVGNICAAMAPNYWVLLLARFVSGLPHGAYFGVASIVAEKLADKGKGSEAVDYDSRDDYCQSFRGSTGYIIEQFYFVAGYFFVGRLLGSDYSLLYMALGTSCGRTERYRFQRAVPFSEDTGSLAYPGCDGIREWRCLLLV